MLMRMKVRQEQIKNCDMLMAMKVRPEEMKKRCKLNIHEKKR